jgi:hypothetical protein
MRLLCTCIFACSDACCNTLRRGRQHKLDRRRMRGSMHRSMGCTLATWSQHHDQAETNKAQATASAHSIHQTVSMISEHGPCMSHAHFVPQAATEGQQQVGS